MRCPLLSGKVPMLDYYNIPMLDTIGLEMEGLYGICAYAKVELT